MRFSTNVLKWLAVVLPVGFMVGVLYVRLSFFDGQQALAGNVYTLLAVALGATMFSIFIFNVIEAREEEIRLRGQQLEALHEAALALTHELDLELVLQQVVDLSRELLGAHYGALGILNDEGNAIGQFITSGIDPQQHARIGALPTGKGLLGVISPGGEPLIVNNIAEDERSVGFPEYHPHMRSLLGVPIKSKGEVFGNLYVADKFEKGIVDDDLIHKPFTQADRQLLEKFATQAAIAIENAQLYGQVRELAVLKERERFSMDLHDGIMQSVYATGLGLQEAEHQLEEAPDEARQRIHKSVEELSQVLRDIRNYILGLRPERFRDQDLVAGLKTLADELHANTLMTVEFHSPDGARLPEISAEQTAEVLHVAQEALTNVRKHARASRVDLRLTQKNGQLLLEIKDDGVGFRPENANSFSGHGLRNIRERARSLGAELEMDSDQQAGTRIRLLLPAA